MTWEKFIELLDNPAQDEVSAATAYLALIDNPDFFDEPVAIKHAFDLLQKKRPVAASMVKETLRENENRGGEYAYLSSALA
ncbi:MAG: hypothetical protein NTZ97_00955 [Candidatus Moranbacteria bacterium]|nr:hypothetical protein [Candidatus Moranbacteria bacterium]